MTHSEQEEILRRALHAVADQIEPAADGLERIRERLSKPRPLAVALLMAGWTGLAQPSLLRLEPVLAELAGRMPGRLAEWLRLMVRSLRAAGARLRPAGARLRPAGARLRPAGVRLRLWVERLGELLVDAIRMLRPGSGMSRHEKLRAGLAFGAAALIGAAGGFGLSEGVPPVISTVGGVFTSGGSVHSASASGHGSVSANTAMPIQPTSGSFPGSTRGPNLAPRPACSPAPKPSADPDPAPTTSTPSPSTSTSTPSPSTSTSTPSPSTSTPEPTPAQVNASASPSPGVPPSSGPGHPVNGGSVGTRPMATATPTTGANTKPTPSPTTSGCG